MKQGEDKKWYTAFCRKRTWILVLLPISLILLWMVQKNEEIAEYVFARGTYRWLSQSISLISGAVPFSIMELELMVLPVIGLLLFARFIWKLVYTIRKRGSIGYLLSHGILNLGAVISVLLFLFVMLGGVNYYRYPFTTFSGLEIRESSIDELYNLNMNLVKQAAELRSQIKSTKTADQNGALQFGETSWTDISVTAKEAFDKLAEQYPILAGNYGTPKPVYFSRFMSRMEITGIFWPFTMEANVNVDVPEYTIPATMLHELAHLRGFMREDEANFIAYLASKQSDNLIFQYSGIMLALTYTSNQLYNQDKELYMQVSDNYDIGMTADLRQSYYYWEMFEDTVISTAASTMNDTYLKANSQGDGVKSYGRMVDLLLAEYRNNNKEE
ncbi:MAG: hypothetical protein K0R92_687 [Lachnospiraceae bacterium]|jgi:hypothetical protein|nr:hypothetical protein [Lachnospiraceae bacterium]